MCLCGCCNMLCDGVCCLCLLFVIGCVLFYGFMFGLFDCLCVLLLSVHVMCLCVLVVLVCLMTYR